MRNTSDEPGVSPAEAESSDFHIYHEAEHGIDLAKISMNAVKVVSRLQSEGYQAYLVGGCVRDLLLNKEPKDFDVATNASPEEVRGVFRNSRLIGRRFRLAHVRFGREIIEVATFRGGGDADASREVHQDGRILRDNVYGSMDEDALRRDFTINALYLDPEEETVLDRADGMADHQKRLIRLIGDPVERYREDPVRLLRAARFAAKLGFEIETRTLAPVQALGSLLDGVPQARLYEEILKLFLSGHAQASFKTLREHDLLRHLFPQTAAFIEGNGISEEYRQSFEQFIAIALRNTDARIAENKPVTPYFLFSALLWGGIHQHLEKRKDTESEYEVLQLAMSDTLSRQAKVVAIPKRASIPMREVWSLQARFRARKGARPYRLLEHPRFRAAYDFLLLRAETGSTDPELAEWWTTFQTANTSQRRKMTQQRKKKLPANQGEVDPSVPINALDMLVEEEEMASVEDVAKPVAGDSES